MSYDFLPDCEIANRYRDSRLAADGSRSLAELVSLLAEHPLARQPGEQWVYSYATDVLAHVIECVCNQPLADCLQVRLFSPLDMRETSFSLSEEKHPRVADMFGMKELSEVDTGQQTTNTLYL